ncbi:MAG: metallophosphoesterase family protein [Ferruginibacter sp.]
MKILYFTITTFIFLLVTTFVKADDIIFPMGQNLGGAPAWKYKGGGNNFDGTLWKTLSFSETSWLTTNSAIGFGNSTPVRSTDIPTDNSAGGGGSNGSRYPTLYFRKTVNIADPTAYYSFTINTQFDDGIVIWINGVEAFRNNIIANPTYSAWATASLSGNGATIFTATIANSMFIPGDNIIAVEVHQNAANSNDLFFDMELIGDNSATSAVLTRGPYLQSGSQNALTFRWRTDVSTDSRVTWGSAFGSYTDTIDSSTLTTEHIVRISGLNPDTKYWYTIGSTTQTIQATNTNYFLTLPPDNTNRKLKFLAIGDCGNASTNQVDTKNAFVNFIGTNNIDAMISLGDNAYSSGLDNELQTEFFDIYKNDILKYYKLYTSPGNHDYGNNSANTGVRNNAYYNSFSNPTAGEAGGSPSGTEAYYSFNVGDVHFVSLDSYGMENSNTTKIYDTLGTQCVWLKNDLGNNTKKWVVVYFHHPPYTKTSHNSDSEQDLIDMRENFIRIMERYGVDLVLNGHAHGYERSYLLKNFYKAPGGSTALYSADFVKALHTADSSSAKYNGSLLSCAYNYNSGKYQHGSVYVVSGSAGQIGGSATGYPHKAMVYSNNTNGGCFYFEVNGNRLDAKFISYSGTGGSVAPLIRDSFTIFKDVNKVQDIVIATNTLLTLAASWPGTYSWPNNAGATTQTVSINTATNGTFNYIVRDANNCLKDSFHVIITAPVAVSVIDFTAQARSTIVALQWTSSKETNNRYFNIERSVDGIHWSALTQVVGAGNSSLAHTYHTADSNPYEGFNFYRLSQTDFNGNSQVLDIKKVIYSSSSDLIVNVKNDGKNKMMVSIRAKGTSIVSLKVTDMAGRDLLKESVNIVGGYVEKILNLQNGSYIITVISKTGAQVTNKILVE